MAMPVFRPATLDDAALAADICTASFPRLPEDPVMMRFRWETALETWTRKRFIAEIDGQPVSYLLFEHGPWAQLPDRDCSVEAYLDRAVMTVELQTLLLEWIEEQAVADGARRLTSYAGVEEHELLESLRRLGYEKEREDRVWELDLTKHGSRLLKAAQVGEQAMKGIGIRLTTMADWDDPHRWRKLHELNEMTVQDVPHSKPILPQPFENFVKRMEAPDRPHDRLWIAVDRDRVVAFSFLRYPPVRGHVWTGYTCSHRDYRGRGIARATKLQTLRQAIELGIPVVGTDNDSENAPMLHINEKLGYHQAPGWIQHLKRV